MAADDRWIKSLTSKIKVVTNFKLSDLVPVSNNQPVIQAYISDVTSTTARLNWSVTTPGATITGWDNGRDNVDAGGGGVYQVIDGVTATSRLFNNLVSGREYNLNVQAVTGSGRSNKITLSVTPTVETTTPVTANPSNFAFPNANVTNQFGAWKLNYSTNFDTDAAMGTFHSTSAYANRFDNYDGAKDTTKFGTYDSTKTTFVADGKLQVRMRTINGTPYVSAPIVRTVAGQGYSGQTYGRYSVAMRSVSEALNDGSYKVAFMLWPNDDVWPQHGEYDFPESGLKSGYTGDAAHHRAFTNNVVDKFLSTASIRDWHVYTIEWNPTVVRYLVDGVVIGSASNGVYNGNMRWTLQCETEISSNPPSTGSIERVEIDWLAQWSYTAP